MVSLCVPNDLRSWVTSVITTTDFRKGEDPLEEEKECVKLTLNFFHSSATRFIFPQFFPARGRHFTRRMPISRREILNLLAILHKLGVYSCGADMLAPTIILRLPNKIDNRTPTGWGATADAE